MSDPSTSSSLPQLAPKRPSGDAFHSETQPTIRTKRSTMPKRPTNLHNRIGVPSYLIVQVIDSLGDLVHNDLRSFEALRRLQPQEGSIALRTDISETTVKAITTRLEAFLSPDTWSQSLSAEEKMEYDNLRNAVLDPPVNEGRGMDFKRQNVALHTLAWLTSHAGSIPDENVEGKELWSKIGVAASTFTEDQKAKILDVRSLRPLWAKRYRPSPFNASNGQDTSSLPFTGTEDTEVLNDDGASQGGEEVSEPGADDTFCDKCQMDFVCICDLTVGEESQSG